VFEAPQSQGVARDDGTRELSDSTRPSAQEAKALLREAFTNWWQSPGDAPFSDALHQYVAAGGAEWWSELSVEELTLIAEELGKEREPYDRQIRIATQALREHGTEDSIAASARLALHEAGVSLEGRSDAEAVPPEQVEGQALQVERDSYAVHLGEEGVAPDRDVAELGEEESDKAGH
jgi:hypothetical protein